MAWRPLATPMDSTRRCRESLRQAHSQTDENTLSAKCQPIARNAFACLITAYSAEEVERPYRLRA